MSMQTHLGRAAVAALMLGAISSLAANWPQFRGSQASGVDSNRAAPTNWNIQAGTNVRWRTPIPGLAHASPIVWNDRVYVTTAVQPGKADLKVGLYGDIGSADDQVEHEWRLLALDTTTGKIAWDKLGHKAVPRVKRHTKASHCNSTPATDGGRIVAIFGSEGLFCFGMDGRPVWKKDLGPMDSGYFAVPSAQWGLREFSGHSRRQSRCSRGRADEFVSRELLAQRWEAALARSAQRCSNVEHPDYCKSGSANADTSEWLAPYRRI
jgi:hypothetical protein